MIYYNFIWIKGLVIFLFFFIGFYIWVIIDVGGGVRICFKFFLEFYFIVYRVRFLVFLFRLIIIY